MKLKQDRIKIYSLFSHSIFALCTFCHFTFYHHRLAVLVFFFIIFCFPSSHVFFCVRTNFHHSSICNVKMYLMKKYSSTWWTEKKNIIFLFMNIFHTQNIENEIYFHFVIIKWICTQIYSPKMYEKCWHQYVIIWFNMEFNLLSLLLFFSTQCY